MKEFDIEKLERKMPYSVPENFFEEFTAQTIAKAESVNQNQRSNKRILRIVRIVASCGSVAAMVAIMLMINTTPVTKSSETLSTTQSENSLLSNVEIDSFIKDLSDEELTALVSEVDPEDEFYDYL